MAIKKFTLALGVLTLAVILGGAMAWADEEPIESNEDCPERELGLYCPEDPSPEENPNLDCPERELGLYCPDDPSPEENPNLTESGDGGSDSSGGGGGGGGGDDGDDGDDEEPTPTPTPNPGQVLGASSKGNVPAIVERIFGEVFGRKITHEESVYWKGRFRSDKGVEAALKNAMQWHKANGSTGPKLKQNPVSDLAAKINSLFRSVYDRNPTGSEHAYWWGRVLDGTKSTMASLLGAMQWHNLHGISH